MPAGGGTPETIVDANPDEVMSGASESDSSPPQLRVTVNWFEELKQRAAPNR